MTEMIENRKGERKHDRIDLFSILLEAYESGETEFTKKELLSNMFIFLIAGHEVSLFSSSSIKRINANGGFNRLRVTHYATLLLCSLCTQKFRSGCTSTARVFGQRTAS